jgi:HdeA/HdeB family protein
MPRSTSLLMALIALCAACVPQAPPIPPQAAAPPPTTAAPPPPTVAIVPPNSGSRWDVTRVQCGQLLGADDEDRAAAIMFYYGYLAASSGIRIIDVSKIDQNVARVMDQCVRAPWMTVPQAYRVAFGRRPRS